MKSNNRNLVDGPLLPSILRFIIPIMLHGMLSRVFGVVGSMLAGDYCGSLSLGVIGSVGVITALPSALLNGLVVGTGVVMSQALGRKDEQYAQRIVHTAIPIGVFIGLLYIIVGIPFADSWLKLINMPDSAMGIAITYMKILMLGQVFASLFNYSNTILHAAGETRPSLYIAPISGVVNVGLTYLFLRVFQMDIAGIALASVISQVVSAAFMLIILMRRTDACKLRIRKLTVNLTILKKITKIGMPTGFYTVMIQLANTVIQTAVNGLGDAMMAGFSAAGQIDALANVFNGLFYSAMLNFTGQNMGAGKYKRIKQTMWICGIGNTAITGLLGVLAFAFGPQLLGLFIKDNPDAITCGMARIIFIGLPYFLFGLQELAAGGLWGMGNTLVSMVISGICTAGFQVLWIQVLYRFPQFYTPEGLCMSYPACWLLTFAVQFIVFCKVFKKKARLQVQYA